LNPLAHAAVISINEKGQIQAFAPTKAGLPVNPTTAVTIIHDYYKRDGTANLFAAPRIFSKPSRGLSRGKSIHPIAGQLRHP
jgi:hypothetical protein